MCDPVTGAIIASAVIGGAVAKRNGDQAVSQSKKATAQATANAKTQAEQADQAFNKANAKQPNVAGLESGNQQAALSGQAGTMLTGPQGVDPNALTLGRNTLLGA